MRKRRKDLIPNVLSYIVEQFLRILMLLLLSFTVEYNEFNKHGAETIN